MARTPSLASSLLSALAISALAVSTLAACTEEQDATIVTVNVQPSVRGAAFLEVELKNGAGIAGDRLELRGHEFPVTFSVSSPGRKGDLELKVSAKTADDILVGRGTATFPITATTGTVLVDSADFVVNTEVESDQYLTDDFEAVGSQLSANPAGEWTASFRQRCTPAACNVFARRFDRDGQPLPSGASATTNSFTVNTGRVGVVSSPAAAAGVDKTLLFWETTDTNNAPDGVACRSYDRSGTAPNEKRLNPPEVSTDVVVATPLPNGTFAAAWAGRPTTADTLNIRTMVVDGDCTPLGALQPVATLLPAIGVRQSAIAAGPNSYLIAWKADGTIRARTFNLNGTPATAETTLLTPPNGEEFSMVRVASNNNGFVFVVAHRAGTKVSLELYRVTASNTVAPALVGSGVVITDKLDSVFEGFSVASHPLGPIMVTWHGCGTERGDGEGCGVFGRLFATNGTPFSEPFLVPTTTALDQSDSSVTALRGADDKPLFVASWNDASTSAPDMSGLAVRARIIYPQSFMQQ